MSDANTRRLHVAIIGAGDRTCAACACMDADEHLLYCGIFRRPLHPDKHGTIVRLPECLTAEDNCKPASEAQS